MVKHWLEQNKDNIEIFYLPAYSPELNPDELLNQDVKSNAVCGQLAKTSIELKNNLTTYLFARFLVPPLIYILNLREQLYYIDRSCELFVTKLWLNQYDKAIYLP